MHDYLFGHHEKRLLIQLRIPLTTFRHEFAVYKVTTFPVPVTGRPTYKTFLSNFPRYFVASSHSDFYFTMRNIDNSRQAGLLYLTHNGLSLSSFTTGATCLSAIFRNNVTQIRDLCSFTLHENPLEPQVHFLSNSRIPLINVSQITLNCSTGDRTFLGCTQCVRNIKCNCQVKLFTPNSSQPARVWPPSCQHAKMKLI